MKPFKRLIFLLAGLLICSLLPLSAMAAESADVSRDVSLTISYQDGDRPLVGAVFDIYLAASMDSDGELVVTEEFSRFPVDIAGKMNDTKEWRILASTLEGYVLREQLEPADSGKTDAEGMIHFPQRTEAGQEQSGTTQMQQGLYLVIGHRHQQDGFYYDAAPFLILLPEKEESGEWIYDITAQVKSDSEPIPEEQPDTVRRKVLKIWNDSGNEKERPETVTVQLLRDGGVYDTVILSRENDWRYTWDDLDASCRWTVVEKELKNYTVETVQEGITFTVTNTYQGDVPEESSSEPSEPSSSESSSSEPSSEPFSESSSESSSESEPSESSSSESSPSGSLPGSPGDSSSSGGHGKLPQTGQLWWPVPALVFGGFLLVLAGVIRRRKESDEEK